MQFSSLTCVPPGAPTPDAFSLVPADKKNSKEFKLEDGDLRLEPDLIDGLEALGLEQPLSKASRSVHSLALEEQESLLFLPGDEEGGAEKQSRNPKEAIEKWNAIIRSVHGDISKLRANWQETIRKNGKNLKKLCLDETPITQAILKNSITCSFPNLREFSCAALDDLGLQELPVLKKLRTLTVLNCQNLTNTGLKTLQGLPRLEVLILQQAKNITSGITYLATLVNLKVLTITGSNPKKKDKRISDSHLLSLKPLKQLERLEIGKCQLKKHREIFIELTSALPMLQVQNIHDPEIGAEDFFTKAAGEFGHWGVHKSVIRSVQAHSHFCEFNSLKFPKYDDKSFKNFVETLDVNLTSITITGMQKVTNQGIQYLFQKKWANLKEVHLHSCYSLFRSKKILDQLIHVIGSGITLSDKMLQVNFYGTRTEKHKMQLVIDGHIKVQFMSPDVSIEKFFNDALKPHLSLCQEKVTSPAMEHKESAPAPSATLPTASARAESKESKGKKSSVAQSPHVEEVD